MAGDKQFVHCREVVLFKSVHYQRFHCIHTVGLLCISFMALSYQLVYTLSLVSNVIDSHEETLSDTFMMNEESIISRSKVCDNKSIVYLHSLCHHEEKLACILQV